MNNDMKKRLGDPAICVCVNGNYWYSIGGEPTENTYKQILEYTADKHKLTMSDLPSWSKFKEKNFDMNWIIQHNPERKTILSIYRGLTTKNDID